jgi:hypothetical protein
VDVLRPKEGETIFVSGAAGAVGQSDFVLPFALDAILTRSMCS